MEDNKCLSCGSEKILLLISYACPNGCEKLTNDLSNLKFDTFDTLDHQIKEKNEIEFEGIYRTLPKPALPKPSSDYKKKEEELELELEFESGLKVKNSQIPPTLTFKIHEWTDRSLYSSLVLEPIN